MWRDRLDMAWRAAMARWRGQGAAARDLDFAPLAIALIETPPAPLGRTVLWCVVALLLTTLTWLTLSTHEIVAVAAGKVVPSGRSKMIQAAETAVVRAIRVRDGQRVAAGEVLIELDPTDATAERTRIAQDLAVAKLELARFSALDRAPADPLSAYSPPPDGAAEQVAAERRLIAAAAAERAAQLAAIDGELAKLRAELRTVATQIARFDASLPMMGKKVAARRELHDKGVGSEFALMDMQQQMLEQEYGRAAARSRSDEIRAAIAATEGQRQKAWATIDLKVRGDLHEAGKRVAALEQELVKADSRARLRTLTAPVDGVVQQLAVTTVGGVVTAAQVLAVVVPSDGQPELEVLVLNKDVGFIDVGQRAVVKIDAFNFTRYGLLEGVVASVSGDAIEDKTHGLVYAARILLNSGRDRFSIDGRDLPPTPGMSASVEIATGERRLIEYLLSPLLRYRQEALKER